MNKKIKDLAYTFSANFLNFLMGFITGFIIPKFLGIDDYAYLKIFTFYVTYVGVAHLGLLDGIYIKYGSYNYDDLPRDKFRAYTRTLIIFQILEAIVLGGIMFIVVKDTNRAIISFMVIINMIILNITNLFTFIHQFTKRFKLFSINMILNKLLYVIGCVCLIYFNMFGYINFVIIQTVINALILCIYIYNNKELVFGKAQSLIENFKEFNELIKIGFFVMIGNFMTIIVLGIDRLFVDTLFSLEDFAMYSFAYTLISLFFILLNSLTMVLYPYLTRAKEETYKEIYETIRISITLVMSITLCGYFVIKYIVSTYIPEYTSSFDILIFLVPTVIYSGHITILVTNYYKVLKKTKEYTLNNVVALIISVATNIIAYLMYKDVKAIAVATLISFSLWVIYSDLYFKKILNVRILKANILDIGIISIFIICAYKFNWFLGMIVYICLIIVFIASFVSKDIKKIIEILKRS